MTGLATLARRLPLAVIALVLAAMAITFPSVHDEQQVASGQEASDDGIIGPRGGPASGPGRGDGGKTTGDSTIAVPAKGSAPPTPTGTVTGCGRDRQVPGDGYSPPCVQFSGSNGGATARGVTATEIRVSLRVLDEPGFQDALAQLAGADIADGPEDVKRTAQALVEYFNRRFEFYGRKIKLVFFDGRGSSVNEILGKGQEEAEQDATEVAEKIKAFAELGAGTPPFTDALVRRDVIAFNAPYMSREWYSARRPYAWSLTTDCSIIVETVSEYIHKRLMDGKAKWAGGDLAGQPRKFEALAPENPWYQECVDAGERILESYGRQKTDRIAYKLDLGSMSNQASNIIAKMKADDITSVLCGCDPVFPIFLSSKAEEQDYHPEWIVVGTAFTDLDLIGQLYQQDQWAHAFGISFLGSPQPLRASYGYNAYKQVRNDEPAFTVDLIYYAIYMLAIGIQGAGPNLTPETFEQGMFRYPGGTGPVGTWKFGPQDYTPTGDSREIWWDPDRTSPQNSQKGAYVESAPGVRYDQGEWPTGEPKVFS